MNQDKRKLRQEFEEKTAQAHGPFWMGAHRDPRYLAVVIVMLALAFFVFVFWGDVGSSR